MAYRYPIYTHRNNNSKALYESLGAIILLGGMAFVLGFILVYHELLVVGSGMMIAASLCHICTMENHYYQERYDGLDTRQMEEGATSE